MHHAPLVAILVGGFVLAFILGALANRLRVSPLVGYLLAGIAIGPFTPGFVADTALAGQLAEVGVILLMFGVGLHFSLDDLLAVRNIALPGAIGRIVAVTALGALVAGFMGWPLAAGLVFGLCLSVASTVVLLRALEERGLLESERGRIAVGWLIVEDLVMVLALVVLPALAGSAAGAPTTLAGRLADAGLWLTLALTIGKVALFVAIMLVVGRRAVPWLLARMALTGSRELFTLAVLAIALGIAGAAAELFGASFALGAFFAGMVLAGSEQSHDAAEQSLPLRDAFAVLFFVSVGMLLNPAVLAERPLAVLAAVLIIVVGKSVAAFAIVRLLGFDRTTAVSVSVSLAQVGEFSFILASLGTSLGLLPDEGQDLILAGAIASILLNPLLFEAAAWAERRWPGPSREPGLAAEDATPVAFDLRDHVVLVGCGRVGARAAKNLRAAGLPFVAVERQRERAVPLREQGVRVVVGDAERPEIIAAAGVGRARALLVAVPGGYEAGRIVAVARASNPSLPIIARAHGQAEVDYLLGQGVASVVLAEHELADRMVGLLPAAPAPA